MLKIGIIGCGTIGTCICKAIDDGLMEAEVYAIYDRNAENVERLQSSLVNLQPAVMEAEEMIKHIDLLVECASQEAVYEVVPAALHARCDVMIMSVGAFADERLFKTVYGIAKEMNCKIYLPSGAIAGLDGLKSAASEQIYSVTLTTQKPPAGLAGAPYVVQNKIKLDEIKSKTVIFEGKASEAVKGFPANVNVAATLSLAGTGFEKTKVKIIANPALCRNIHEITVEGAFGKLTSKVENVPSPNNPKSSYLAPLSAIATLKKIIDPLQIGT
ncbi:aspartate dehydrogenase [Methanomethylovorans hollandica DSM 15978]|uniref:L-aspartate dehydrogenase n=1 Tax=Methanomethylovorans hollandica (strain DSM 15978 / NBRC 107637 / DMS1) TaxID=867904 RepID=L0KX10_METHD|nr:aspartate dehydrogenase [Methanomethylovorans hollandica]AGB48613.1 aspartate dehydrogenase [Methanomethylovorans hollandica DSM 15978]